MSIREIDNRVNLSNASSQTRFSFFYYFLFIYLFIVDFFFIVFYFILFFSHSSLRGHLENEQ